MVKILAGGKGEGKTKKLIDMANAAVANAHGTIVYIDDDSRHIYDLKHSVRFVEIKEFPLVNYRELVGFIYGVLSQNSDIEQIYIDGLYKIVEKLDKEDIIKLMSKLSTVSKSYSVEFIISANINPADLPKEISDLII